TISDEIVALELGSVIVRGTAHDVVNDPQVVASYLGTTDEVIQRSGEVASADEPELVGAGAASKPTRPLRASGSSRSAGDGSPARASDGARDADQAEQLE